MRFLKDFQDEIQMSNQDFGAEDFVKFSSKSENKKFSKR
jgi:hypothetical protein